MTKLPRTNVIERQLTVALEDSHGDDINPAALEAIQGGVNGANPRSLIGIAPMYGAPRPGFDKQLFDKLLKEGKDKLGWIRNKFHF